MSKVNFSVVKPTLGLRVLTLTAAVMIGLGSAAHATDYSEGPLIGNTGHPLTDTPSELYDLSSVGNSPTSIGPLTLGGNFITGATIPYGAAGPMGRANQDNDFVTFSVPVGDVLSSLYLVAPSSSSDGTTIQSGDLFFVGIASGPTVNVTPPSSAGLLGYSLVSSSQIGSDILPALGASAPAGFTGPPYSGATTFSGALPAGTYSLWLLDGDSPVSYDLDLQVSSAPEPAMWVMMLIGVAGLGLSLRRSRKAGIKPGIVSA